MKASGIEGVLEDYDYDVAEEKQFNDRIKELCYINKIDKEVNENKGFESFKKELLKRGFSVVPSKEEALTQLKIIYSCDFTGGEERTVLARHLKTDSDNLYSWCHDLKVPTEEEFKNINDFIKRRV